MAGVRDMSGIAVGIAAWGLVTGMAMVQSGMGLPLAVLMSVFVFAGSAQLATMPLLAAGAPLWVIWTTAACVNLRFLIFSAAWRPYLVGLPFGQRLRIAYFTADLNYVLFMRRFPDPQPDPRQLPYFWGGALVNWGAWSCSRCWASRWLTGSPRIGASVSRARWACSGCWLRCWAARRHGWRRSWPAVPPWRPTRCR